ncbi:MAG: NUDIX domain-containing protein [Ginsengibacter sp.]
MFNLRAYGLLINELNQILVSDEYILGEYFTKFPGGGVELGEGTRDCLKREFKEEMDLNIKVKDHFYTTDFFQPSAFRKGDQIVSIYYFVKPLEEIKIPLTQKPFDFSENQLKVYKETEQIETFRFIDLEKFNSDCVSLPIDKIVAKMLVENPVFRKI